MASLCIEKKNLNSFPWLARSSLIWYMSLLQLHFVQCFPNSFCSGHTAHLWFPAQAQLTPTSLCLCCAFTWWLFPPFASQFRCGLLRGTFPDHPPWRPPSHHLYLTMVPLFFSVPFIHNWNDLVYVLVDCLIGIGPLRQQGLFYHSTPAWQQGRHSTNIYFLKHFSVRLKECYGWKGLGKQYSQIPPLEVRRFMIVKWHSQGKW